MAQMDIKWKLLNLASALELKISEKGQLHLLKNVVQNSQENECKSRCD